MPKRYKEARLMNKVKLTDMADKLGVSQPTLSAWESERKAAPIEAIIKMADIYGVTVDYLLGRDDVMTPAPNEPISRQVLMIYNGKPVWSAKFGWLLVSSVDRQLLSSDGSTIPFADADQLFIAPPLFAEPKYPLGKPLVRQELIQYADVWVEPISPDSNLRNELRGRYQVKNCFVQNEYGNRFYLDTYGAKWLAFQSEIEES